MTKFKLVLTFEIPEHLTIQQAQELICEQVLSGQISIDTNRLKLIEVNGTIKGIKN